MWNYAWLLGDFGANNVLIVVLNFSIIEFNVLIAFCTELLKKLFGGSVKGLAIGSILSSNGGCGDAGESTDISSGGDNDESDDLSSIVTSSRADWSCWFCGSGLAAWIACKKNNYNSR